MNLPLYHLTSPPSTNLSQVLFNSGDEFTEWHVGGDLLAAATAAGLQLDGKAKDKNADVSDLVYYSAGSRVQYAALTNGSKQDGGSREAKEMLDLDLDL